MIRKWAKNTLGSLCVALVVGCATVPKDAGFGSVQKAVTDRTGHRIRWNRETAADQEAARAVQSLLQQELAVDDAVQITLLNNRTLQATYEELGVAQAELVEAGLLRNPTLTAEVRFPKSPSFPFD